MGAARLADHNQPAPTEDRLLVTADAVSRLAASKHWLYRHADRMPFTVLLAAGQVRFSAKGIDRWIASRLTGRRL